MNASTIQLLYEQEVLKITTPNSEMGIWQLWALASVLQSNIFSIYPKLGHGFERRELHRLLMPRITTDDTKTVHVMWTSTKQDMQPAYWLPNHFVPAIPMSKLGNGEVVVIEDSYDEELIDRSMVIELINLVDPDESMTFSPLNKAETVDVRLSPHGPRRWSDESQ